MTTNSAPADGAAPFLTLDAMRLNDVPTVGRLERICFTMPWSESAYRNEILTNPRSFYFVLRSPDDDPVLPPILAYGGYWLLGEDAHIVTIASHPDFRGRSLGELMLLQMIGHARPAGIVSVTLEVRPSNTAARSLYAKWGFVDVGLRRRYYRDNNEDAILMTLHNVDDETAWAPMAARRSMLQQALDRTALHAAAPPP